MLKAGTCFIDEKTNFMYEVCEIDFNSVESFQKRMDDRMHNFHGCLIVKMLYPIPNRFLFFDFSRKNLRLNRLGSMDDLIQEFDSYLK